MEYVRCVCVWIGTAWVDREWSSNTVFYYISQNCSNSLDVKHGPLSDTIVMGSKSY